MKVNSITTRETQSKRASLLYTPVALAIHQLHSDADYLARKIAARLLKWFESLPKSAVLIYMYIVPLFFFYSSMSSLCALMLFLVLLYTEQGTCG